MPLTVEDGTGVYGADAYVSAQAVDTYWANRPHSPFSASWAAGSTANREGAIREATAYLDATYYLSYRGISRRTEDQGLQWPRSDAYDDEMFDLPDLPQQIRDATCELAVRALSEALSPDSDQQQSVKRLKEKVGAVETETEYQMGEGLERKFSFVERLLAPVLKATRGWEWM